jgi:pyridoxamine 5'-phosphate oxidase
MSLPPWRSPLARALHRNRSLPQARYLQLATIDLQGYPRNRTLVFRGWLEPDSRLQMVTDCRSAKIAEIVQHPQGAICWYFPKTREQFRLSGSLHLIDRQTSLGQIERQQAWQQLSSNAQQQFAWPSPGTAVPDSELLEPAPIKMLPPIDNFGLLLLAPTCVDHLELRGNPQQRWCYSLVAGEWLQSAVHP